MPIDTTTTVSAASPTVTAPANPTSQMGKDTFLKLLVAELKAQDPLNPTDSREMITQLTSLTSVEKLTSLDQNIAQLRGENAGMASMQASGLLGASITAKKSHLMLTGEAPAAGQFVLDGVAASVQITVRDAAGTLVRTLDIGAQNPGTRTFTWDGLDDEGVSAPEGGYTFEVNARSQSGLPVAASTRVSGVVSEVSYENGVPELIVGDARVLLGDVSSIAR